MKIILTAVSIILLMACNYKDNLITDEKKIKLIPELTENNITSVETDNIFSEVESDYFHHEFDIINFRELNNEMQRSIYLYYF